MTRDNLEWGTGFQMSNLQRIKEDHMGSLVTVLGLEQPHTIDSDSDEVITIMWDEENMDGPNILLIEEEDLIVGSGRITYEEEEDYRERYLGFLNNLT